MNVGWLVAITVLVQRGVTSYYMLDVKIMPDRRQALDSQILQANVMQRPAFDFVIGSLHLSSSKKKKKRKCPTSFPEK